MTRADRRREERCERKGDLGGDTVARLNAQRRLPADHPSVTSAAPLFTPPEQANRYLDLIGRSGVGVALEARLEDHPGRRSRLRAEALILAALLAVTIQSYRRTDLCAVLNGLDAQVAFRVGLCDRHTRTPISYSTTHKQAKRFETALEDGWIAADGQEWNLHWFRHWILHATIPPRFATRITAVAVDSTFVESWATTKDYSREADPLAEHRIAARDAPDLPEPALGSPTGCASSRIGSIGGDGRRIRSADADARPGYRSATAKTLAGVALGYDLHLACAVRDSRWGGHPDRLTLGEPMPAFITALDIASGSTDPGPTGLRVVEDSLSLAPNICEVVADRGYTTKRLSFVRPLHKQGIDVVMDYTTTEVARPKVLTVSGGTQPLIMHCGTILPPWLPDTMHAPSPALTDTERSASYNARAPFRWVENQNLDGGKRQMLCPQCAGRVTTNAETRNLRKEQSSPSAPHLHTTNPDTCCHGLAVLSVDQLDAYQKIPYGTTAWQHSYGRRNQIENANSRLKDKGGLKAGWIRAFGRTPHYIGATALVAVYNLALIPETEHDDAATPAGLDQPPEPPSGANTPDGPANLRAPP